MLEKVIHANQTVYTIDDYKNDVKENIAYSGSGGYKKGESGKGNGFLFSCLQGKSVYCVFQK